MVDSSGYYYRPSHVKWAGHRVTPARGSDRLPSFSCHERVRSGLPLLVDGLGVDLAVHQARPGWERRIRTPTDRARACCPAIRRSPKMAFRMVRKRPNPVKTRFAVTERGPLE